MLVPPEAPMNMHRWKTDHWQVPLYPIERGASRAKYLDRFARALCDWLQSYLRRSPEERLELDYRHAAR